MKIRHSAQRECMHNSIEVDLGELLKDFGITPPHLLLEKVHLATIYISVAFVFHQSNSKISKLSY